MLYVLLLLFLNFCSIYCSARPLVIAHRGYSAILPENSMEAFIAAAYVGVDYVEMDIHITKDNQLVVIHDPTLDRVTNVDQIEEFRGRNRTLDGVNGFYIMDFTYEEILRLTLKQNLVPGRIDILDNYFKIPLLSTVVQKIQDFNKQHQGNTNPDGNICGMLIECKNPEIYRKYLKVEQAELIVQLLKRLGIETNSKHNNVYIFLHSFDYDSIKIWKQITSFPTSFLSDLSSLPDSLANIRRQTQTLGVLLQALWDFSADGPSDSAREIKKLQFDLMAWTFRDDQLSIGNINRKQYWIAQKLIQVQGVITEFPSAAVNLVQDYQIFPNYDII